MSIYFLTFLQSKIESNSLPLDYRSFLLTLSKWNKVEIKGRTYETWLVKEPPWDSALGAMSQDI